MKGILANGIAHVSFPGGGIFLPVRNPYDRQVLTEHVAHHARTSSQVQVLIDDLRWMVSWRVAGPQPTCCVCGFRMDVACYATTAPSAPHCMSCAFTNEVEQLPRPEAHGSDVQQTEPPSAWGKAFGNTRLHSGAA